MNYKVTIEEIDEGGVVWSSTCRTYDDIDVALNLTTYDHMTKDSLIKYAGHLLFFLSDQIDEDQRSALGWSLSRFWDAPADIKKSICDLLELKVDLKEKVAEEEKS